MKLFWLVGLLALTVSCSHMGGDRSVASEKGNEIGNRLIKDGDSVYVRSKKHEIYFSQYYGAYAYVIEDNILYLKFKNTNEKFPLGEFTESKNSVRVSQTEFKVNVIKNKKNRDFEAMTCSHMGCLPIPNVQTNLQQLVEVPTLDNQVLCYNNGYFKELDMWTKGNCPTP